MTTTHTTAAKLGMPVRTARAIAMFLLFFCSAKSVVATSDTDNAKYTHEIRTANMVTRVSEGITLSVLYSAWTDNVHGWQRHIHFC